MTMRWIGGVQGYSFNNFSTHMLQEQGATHSLSKSLLISAFQGHVHNLSISLILRIRMIAKMNFANKRDIIEQNMKQIDVTKVHYNGKSFETSMLYLEKSLLCKWYSTIARQFMD